MEAKRLVQIAAPRLAQTISNWVSLCAGRRSSGILPIAVFKALQPASPLYASGRAKFAEKRGLLTIC